MKTKTKYKVLWGAVIFVGKRKVGEKHFKSEKDLAYFLYQQENNNHEN